MRIILASASPRRKDLLKNLFQTFEVIPATGAETYTKNHPPDIVQQLALQKAAEVEQKFCGSFPADAETRINTDACLSANSCGNEDYLVIGADTIVVSEGRILGKPRNASHAAEMLHSLAGNVHQVYTGVALILSMQGRRQCLEFAECTHVRFYPMTEEEIEAYIRSGEPMDKAGSYGIQGMGGRFVQGLDGDYQNVVGLPVARLYQVFKKIKDFPLPF